MKIWVGSFASCFIHGIHGGKIMGTMIIGTYVVLGVGAVPCNKSAMHNSTDLLD